MKFSFGFFIIFLINFNSFSQKGQSQFVVGEIYVKVKAINAKTIKTNSKTVVISEELPFLSNIKASKNITKAEKPFLNLKNKDLNNIIRLKVSESQNIDDLIAQLKDEGYYEYVEKIPLRSIISTPNDPSFATQWSLTKINAPQAWDVNPGGSNIVVAVVDNAIQTTHPDLAANMLAGKDMSSELDFDPNPPNDNFSHGTHVAGILSAVTNNSIGIAAAANNKVKIMPIKATPDDGNPNSIYYGFEGVVWAVDHGAKIVSLSWGGVGYSSAEQDVMNYAFDNNVIVVAAAGNDNNAEPSYPAAYNHVISVASLDANDAKSSFSTFGSTVDISAPGRSILSTLPTNTYASYSGTSMATPLVASCLGYLWSCFPTLTMAELEILLKSTADDISSQNPGFDGSLGAGRVNLLNAISCANENIDQLSLNISPSRFFCVGDSAIIAVPFISGANYSWKLDGNAITGTDSSIYAKNEGVYSLTISKNSCIKTLISKPFVYNLLLSESPVADPKISMYCSGIPDTLKALSPICSFPEFYQKNYVGPTVGYDGYDQSGDDMTILLQNTVGLIDSLEVSITWQKKDGGGAISCGTVDAGGIPYNEEVSFKILSPSGQELILVSEGTYARGLVTSGEVTTVFKNSAPSIGSNSLPASGSFAPQSSFAILNGENANGVWKLLPSDNSFLDPLCVSGFSIKVYTNAHLSTNVTTWWDNATGGNLISSNSELILSNLPVGINEYFTQNQCTGLCPSPRTKAEVYIKNTPEIVGFPKDDILLTQAQAQEIMYSTNIQVSKNASNLYYVSGTNIYSQNFNYLISSSPPLRSPVSFCNTANYGLLAMGCTGTVLWSNGETNQGVYLQNINNEYQITATCQQAWNCPVPSPTTFSFFKANANQTIDGIVDGNLTQNTFAKKLTSVQKIIPTTNILYQANESILLSPGFSVKAGNVFTAKIGGCF
ncbi:hypothetical protein EGI22_06045 [Lacihabitans sp. LS3-19]|uniref:S8 family serine peptidase n=1 Tax=Lacihabitans sp. LS3-19 TaxID=2487335 RepID=UPI0020CED90F|nr:S8 family serine peptidase [Lacihabitans sp. LS3-19]MCP9767465.1 hypothetical protein [Lacihabitans sp. LS3-19]